MRRPQSSGSGFYQTLLHKNGVGKKHQKKSKLQMARGATLKGHHEAPHPSAQSIRSDSVGTVSLLHMNLLPLSF